LTVLFALGRPPIAGAQSPSSHLNSTDTPYGAVFERASAAVVKLYGPGAGREHGYGTGVLVSPDGQILTTLSLLVSAGTIQVVLADGRRVDGVLVRSDETRQLALLKIDATGLPYLTPHASTHLQIGDAVIALGNWFKIADGRETISMNRGIVSLYAPLVARRLAQQFEYAGPVLMVDAITANPGASGGPLLDIDGNFVGLIGKVVEAESTLTRINYAMPAEELTAFLGNVPTTRPVASAAEKINTVEGKKPYIGIKLARLGYRHVSAFVDRVRPGSPAASAGIQPDDLILAIDGRRLTSADSFDELTRDLVPGQSVSFTVKRGAQLLTLTVSVASEQ
jgi:serine protease Do